MPTPSEFLADLDLIEASLARIAANTPAASRCAGCAARVEAFGFHLATLDLRQDSAVHDVALSALLGDRTGRARPADERARALARAGCRQPAGTVVDASARGRARRWTSSAPSRELRPRYGDRAFGPYIISMSRSAADALAVLALARAAGCVERDGNVPLDVAPLFETVADLEAAPDTLALAVRRSGLSRPPGRARRSPGGDARLFRQRQGRRHRRLALGVAAGAGRADRAGARSRRAHRFLPRPRRLGRRAAAARPSAP